MNLKASTEIESAVWLKYLKNNGILKTATELKIDFHVVKRLYNQFTQVAIFERANRDKDELMQLRNIEKVLFELYDQTKDHIGRLPVKMRNRIANLESVYVRTKLYQADPQDYL